MTVVVKSSGSPLTEDAVANWRAQRLSASRIPRFVVFVDTLPHTIRCRKPRCAKTSICEVSRLICNAIG